MSYYFAQLKSYLYTSTLRQSVITTTGTLLNGALGIIFYILVARFLGPVNFGLLTISIASLTLVSDIADLGINSSILRFIPGLWNSERKKALQLFKLALEIKIVAWGVILIGGYFLSPVVAQQIFHKEELTLSLRLASLGVGGALLFSFTASSLQALQKYKLWSLINISANFLRLVLILLLVSFGQINLGQTLIAYIAVPFLGFSLALMFLPTRSFLTATNSKVMIKPVFVYSRWVTLSIIISALSSRLDTFISASLLTTNDLGIYGVATQLNVVIPQIAAALGVVAAPKFASFTSKSQMLSYLKKFEALVIGLSLIGLLAIPLSFYFIPLIYGEIYSQAIYPFIILLISMTIFLISVPLNNCINYYFGKPQLFTWVSLGNLLVIGGLGVLLISSYGLIGAAFTVLAGMLFSLAVPLIWFLRQIQK